METVNISQLHNWNKNPRTISPEGYDRLESQLRLGQFRPLLVTPDGDSLYTVIGGNMRLKVLQAKGVDQVPIMIIDFVEEDGVWYAVIDGVKQTERSFPTKEDGMMEYALADNDRAGRYDIDMLANLEGEFSISWKDYALDISEPKTIEDLLEKETTPRQKKLKEVVCPNCSHAFTL